MHLQICCFNHLTLYTCIHTPTGVLFQPPHTLHIHTPADVLFSNIPHSTHLQMWVFSNTPHSTYTYTCQCAVSITSHCTHTYIHLQIHCFKSKCKIFLVVHKMFTSRSDFVFFGGGGDVGGLTKTEPHFI